MEPTILPETEIIGPYSVWPREDARTAKTARLPRRWGSLSTQRGRQYRPES